MPFQHRYIDQKIYLLHPFADIQFHTAAVHRNTLILLHIPERNLILLFKPVISTHFKSFPCLITDPGTLHHHKIPETMLFQIFNNTCNHLRMCRCTPGSLRRRNQIRLDSNFFISVLYMGLKIRSLQKFLCHSFIICSRCN